MDDRKMNLFMIPHGWHSRMRYGTITGATALEKALCLMNVLKSRLPGDEITLKGDGRKVCVSVCGKEYVFQTSKDLDLPEKCDFEF